MTRVPEPQPFLPEPGTNQIAGSGPEHDLRALFGQSTVVFVLLAGLAMQRRPPVRHSSMRSAAGSQPVPEYRWDNWCLN